MIEQAVSAAIAAEEERIPRRHPARINAFLDLYDPGTDLEERLLTWLRRRSDAQYVDIRGDEVTIPHEQFDETDAERILEDAGAVLRYVEQVCSGQ